MKDDGGQAFPLATTEHNFGGFGMTLRDYYAGKAMEKYMPSAETLLHLSKTEQGYTLHWAAERCYEAADAMLRERGKE